jgi:hypothetical protein
LLLLDLLYCTNDNQIHRKAPHYNCISDKFLN